MSDSKKISSQNPNVLINFKVGILENSTIQLLETLDEIAKECNLSTDEQNELKVLIYKAYVKEKANHFMEKKLAGFMDYLSDAYKMALKNKSQLSNSGEYTEITYLNHTKKLLSNEYI